MIAENRPAKHLFMLQKTIAILVLLLTHLVTTGTHLTADEPPRPLLLGHYMPWYKAKPASDQWGWHWTMNHFDPEELTDGKRQIAAHHYPLIGPYDSGDRDVVEYHLLLMKMAGIDGVIVDWYGLQDFRDYAELHRNTTLIADQVDRLKMKLVICYEDQTIPALVEGGRLADQDRVGHASREIQWLAKHWFPRDSYVRLDGKPVLLSFGHAGLTNGEWESLLARFETPLAYFSEHYRRQGADGGFDWPIPKQGLKAIDRFEKASKEWPDKIPVVYPRFIDIYAQANVNSGYGRIEDADGSTFRQTLQRAFRSRPRIIQFATWNDWGEGTEIEPSHEFGFRDLEVIQAFRRQHVDPSFSPKASDLRLPWRLYQHRKKGDVRSTDALDAAAERIVKGQTERARQILVKLDTE